MKEDTPQRSLRVSMGTRHTLLWEFFFFLIFLLWQNMHNIKCIILTIFKPTVP